MSEKSERISTSVEDDFKKALRIEAAKREMSMSELVREILEENFDPQASDMGNLNSPPATVTSD